MYICCVGVCRCVYVFVNMCWCMHMHAVFVFIYIYTYKNLKSQRVLDFSALFSVTSISLHYLNVQVQIHWNSIKYWSLCNILRANIKLWSGNIYVWFGLIWFLLPFSMKKKQPWRYIKLMVNVIYSWENNYNHPREDVTNK